MRNKFKYLFKNMGLLFISNFSSKILIFLLVPLYTSVLSTEEYGTYDIIYTTVQLLTPILSLNISDAVMRFSIGADRKSQEESFTCGVKFVSLGVFVTSLGIFAGKILIPNGHFTPYLMHFLWIFVAYILNNLVIQFARGIDDISGIAISGVLSTITSIVLNIAFLLYFKLGIDGYFYAVVISSLIPVIFLGIRNRLWSYLTPGSDWLKLSPYEKEMLNYSIPIIWVALYWYINNAADRYAVTLFCGIDVNGLYSVAHKIPAILNVIQGIFIQAWQLSAIKEYDKESGEIFYRRVYQGCQIIMSIMCSGLLLFNKVVAHILFAKEFYTAWVFAPFLLLSVVFNILSGVAGSVFSATKDSGKLATSAIVGSTVNVILNFILCFTIGGIGAAIATFISSVVIWFMRMKALRKHMYLKLNYKRHILQYALLLVQATLMICLQNNTTVLYVSQTLLLFATMLVSFYEFKEIKNGIV